MWRDFSVYSTDRWNVFDVLGLLISGGGFLVRVFDNASAWGRGLYALSTPLMVSRVLFFAQMLHFQGPMVQASPTLFHSTYVSYYLITLLAFGLHNYRGILYRRDFLWFRLFLRHHGITTVVRGVLNLQALEWLETHSRSQGVCSFTWFVSTPRRLYS